MGRKRESPYAIDGLRLVNRGGVWYINGSRDGERIRQTTGTQDLRRAKVILTDFVHEIDSGWRAGADDNSISWRSVARVTWKRHRWSAVARGLPFEITVDLVFSLMEATGFRCAISGIAFSRRPFGGKPDPWSPSIDRIENRHGYLPDNIRIVSSVANMAMNQWGYDTLLRLARGVVRSANIVREEPDLLEHKPDTLLNGNSQHADL